MAASILDPVGDGCTGWFDGTWRACCDAHDIAYALHMDKLKTDIDLAVCVAKTGHVGIALIMFLGVTIFGGFWYRRSRPDQQP